VRDPAAAEDYDCGLNILRCPDGNECFPRSGQRKKSSGYDRLGRAISKEGSKNLHYCRGIDCGFTHEGLKRIYPTDSHF
jgi:hypothetical protein